mgnify:CR=1 FL=1
MLNSLHIENIAIIDSLDVDFGKGFSVLTGETGAGKSIIIDSIQLLVGNKASKDLIRTGADAAIVSACFSGLSDEAIALLDENGLSPDPEGNIIIFRKIGVDGRNNARINGINVTVSLLKQLGEQLINIHGQHDGVLLLDPKRHLGYLDAFGNIDETRQAYEDAYDSVKKLRDKLAKCQELEALKETRRKELEQILAELEQSNIQPGEYDELMNLRKNLLKNTEITEALHTASTAIYDGELPAAQLAKMALDSLISIQKFFPQGEEYVSRLTQISADLDDLGATLGKLFDSYAGELIDPQKLESRLDLLEEICKKYGPGDEEVFLLWNKCKTEYENLDNNAQALKEIELEFATAREKLDLCADKLSAARKNAANAMKARLQEELAYLDMPKIQFEITVQDRINDRGGIRYRNDGKDDVEFFLSANAGEAPRPLAKIASGGELSRIMLALKTVIDKGTDTVIYDEVDTGVSGATAEKIGKKLQGSAGEKQVFSITHLAQIAAQADHHYKVAKRTDNERVVSEIHLLSREGRIREIARIMGGEQLSDTLLQSAEELLINNIK